jgi:hypothetical protein
LRLFIRFDTASTAMDSSAAAGYLGSQLSPFLANPDSSITSSKVPIA